MTARATRTSIARRRLLGGGCALAFARWLPAHAVEGDLPDFPALSAFLAGRPLRWERMRLDLPRLADNGQTVPMKVAVEGPFAHGPYVRAIHLFSQRNPLPDMTVFEFPVPLEWIDEE